MSSDRSYDAAEVPDEFARRATRAAKACRRCHRKKLRCFGGHPCQSCKKAHQSCDFGEATAETLEGTTARSNSDSDGLKKRFEDLEQLVQTLVARSTTQPIPTSAPLPQGSTGQTLSFIPPNYMPTPDQSCLPLNEDDGGFNFIQSLERDLASTDQQSGPSRSVHPTRADPVALHNVQLTDPIEPFLGTIRSPPTPTSVHHARDRHQGSAEGRLALLAQVGSRYSAPLRPLAFQPAHWENADYTRPPSPSREEDRLGQDFWQSMEVRPGLSDDPVTLEWIGPDVADQLVST